MRNFFLKKLEDLLWNSGAKLMLLSRVVAAKIELRPTRDWMTQDQRNDVAKRACQ
jgi:hypothetical protein